MNDIHKDHIKRILRSLGLRIEKSKYLPYSYERKNFSEISDKKTINIFDVSRTPKIGPGVKL
jgi:hypothetical protein